MDTMQTEGFRRAYGGNNPQRVALPPTRTEEVKHELGAEERDILRRWSEQDDARQRTRARIILLSSQGLKPEEVGKQLGIAVPTVYKWLRRFASAGVHGLNDLPRSGQPHRLPKEVRAEILRVTREEMPPEGTRWTIRVAARHLGVTQHQVRQIWADAGFSPHLPPESDLEA